jgi:hypothetical protein
MSKQAEFEYAKILENNIVSQELVGHPQFYQSFMRKYDDLSVDGRDKVEVSIGRDYIALSKRSNYPDATNGIFVSYKDVTSVTFGLEDFHDHKYFRVERDCSSVHTFPNRGDSLGNSSEIELYEDNVLLGRSHFGNYDSKPYGKREPYLGFTKPKLSAGYILNGMLPTTLSHDIPGNYVCHIAGRYSYEDGLVKKASACRTDGRYDGSYSVAAVNLENPMTIDNAADIVIYDKDNNMVRYNTYYNSPKEAQEATQLRYSEAIGKGKKIA